MMKGKEIIEYAVCAEMPDTARVRAYCLKRGAGKDAGRFAAWRRHAIPAAACLVVIIAAAVVFPNLGGIGSGLTPPESNAPAGTDDPASAGTDGAGAAGAQGNIYFNEIERRESVSNNIDLGLDDLIHMNEAELNAFYGVNVFPSEIPGDLSLENAADFGIFRRGKGAGEIYWAQNYILYADEAGKRQATVVVNKDKFPFYDVVADEWTNAGKRKTDLGGAAVLFSHQTSGRQKEDWYFADFICGDAYFNVSARNLTKEEFVDFVRSILE